MSITGYEQRFYSQFEDLWRMQKQAQAQQPTLRDQFAMAALPALIAEARHSNTGANLERLTETAYEIADAMMEARKSK